MRVAQLVLFFGDGPNIHHQPQLGTGGRFIVGADVVDKPVIQRIDPYVRIDGQQVVVLGNALGWPYQEANE